jgi:hypothetical protein
MTSFFMNNYKIHTYPGKRDKSGIERLNTVREQNLSIYLSIYLRMEKEEIGFYDFMLYSQKKNTIDIKPSRN